MQDKPTLHLSVQVSTIAAITWHQSEDIGRADPEANGKRGNILNSKVLKVVAIYLPRISDVYSVLFDKRT